MEVTIKSESGDGIYTVEVRGNSIPVGCTCPDFKYRGLAKGRCKHFVFAEAKASGAFEKAVGALLKGGYSKDAVMAHFERVAAEEGRLEALKRLLDKGLSSRDPLRHRFF